tara:strand:- start:4171 stop:5130 length:960 start_codon:yes stop_codon:yes gene_type:complete
MANKVLVVFVFIYAVGVGNTAYAQGASGLVDGLWFSRDPVTSFGETTVYSVIRNQTDQSLRGIATLMVDGEAVGAQEILVAVGDIQKVNIPYQFSPGMHNVSMNFTAGNGVEVTRAKLQTESIFVLLDTDGDGIQNTTDPDDDNDGIPDSEDTEPLKKNVLSQSRIDLSKAGKDLVEKISGRLVSQGEKTEEEESTQETMGADEAQPNAVVAVVKNIEEIRKRGAISMRERERARREALEEIKRAEEGLPAVTGFDAPVFEESKKREHQIAAAGASIMGAMLEKGWLFYSELFVLTLGILHLMWLWFKKRFADIEVEEE